MECISFKKKSYKNRAREGRRRRSRSRGGEYEVGWVSCEEIDRRIREERDERRTMEAV